MCVIYLLCMDFWLRSLSMFSVVKEELSIRKGTLATAADMLSGSYRARELSMGSLPAHMRIPIQEARLGRFRKAAHQNLVAQAKLETEDKYSC